MNHTEEKPVILIVGDDRYIRQHVALELRETYETVECGNGKVALDKALELIPNLVVTEIHMPGMSGIELCRELKANGLTLHIPVIILTDVNSVESQIEGFGAGVDDYVSSPFNMSLLNVKIQNLLVTRRHLFGSSTSNRKRQEVAKQSSLFSRLRLPAGCFSKK